MMNLISMKWEWLLKTGSVYNEFYNFLLIAVLIFEIQKQSTLTKCFRGIINLKLFKYGKDRFKRKVCS